MKRTAILAIVTAFLFASASVCLAETSAQKTDTQKAQTGEMMGKGMMKHGKPCEKPPMHCFMGKQMIATSDGGIVVLIGNKLYKYDSSLSLQKEAEIPIDMEGMQKMMNMKGMGMMKEPMEKPMEPMSPSPTEKK